MSATIASRFLSSSPPPVQQRVLSETKSDGTMRKDTHSDRQTCRFNPAKLPPFLRAKCPQATAKCVARLLCMESADTVSNWLRLKSRPDFFALGALIDAFGPEFIVAVMDEPPAWAVDAAKRQDIAELERRLARLRDGLENPRD
jgi:hypothetical protein